jgi:DNA polymerase/3'-5' exonuclease PolX
MINHTIAKIFSDIANLLDLKGVAFKPTAYRKVAAALDVLDKDVAEIYKEKGIKGIKEIKGIGKSTAEKIEEYLKKQKIKYYDELQKETAIRRIITHFFETKGVSLQELKENAKKRKIIYSRFTKPAKQLLELAGSIDKAEEAISKVAEWAKSRNLDYAIETVFKKWLELDKLKPKEIVKKPFYRDCPMVWSETKRRWYVIDKYGSWLEFVGKETEIEWKVIK